MRQISLPGPTKKALGRISQGFGLLSRGKFPPLIKRPKGYLAAGAVAGAAAVDFFPFLPFLPFLCVFWLVLAAGVVPELVPCAKAKPVVLPKNNTVIKAAINFFI